MRERERMEIERGENQSAGEMTLVRDLSKTITINHPCTHKNAGTSTSVNSWKPFHES